MKKQIIKEGKYIIYGLKDPNTETIRYIGKSTTGLKLPYEHKKPKNLEKTSYKNHWIKKLLSSGQMYKVEIIEDVQDVTKLDEREKYWIAHYREIVEDLTNLTDGGEGALGRKVSSKTKEKMTISRKKYYKENPDAAIKIGLNSRKPHEFIDGIEYKHCWGCNSFKPIIEYGNNKKTWDKLQKSCKSCHILTTKQWREKNPAKKLTEEELKQSYIDRKSAIIEGLKNHYKTKENRIRLSKQTSKPIIASNYQNGPIILEFESSVKAKAEGFNNTNIWKAIKNNKLYKGYYWRYK